MLEKLKAFLQDKAVGQVIEWQGRPARVIQMGRAKTLKFDEYSDPSVIDNWGTAKPNDGRSYKRTGYQDQRIAQEM
jgi:hypothetical protein